MDWLLKAVTPSEKLLVMVVAIILFSVVMAAILLLADKLPGRLPAAGFLLPALAMLGLGLLYPGTPSLTKQATNSSAGPTTPRS